MGARIWHSHTMSSTRFLECSLLGDLYYSEGLRSLGMPHNLGKKPPSSFNECTIYSTHTDPPQEHPWPQATRQDSQPY